MTKIHIIISFLLIFFNINAAELECPKGAYSTEYTSSFTGEKRVWCSKKINGKFIKHGPEVIYLKNGELKSKKYYELDKLVEKKTDETLKSPTQSSPLRSKIDSRQISTAYVSSAAFDPDGKHLALSTKSAIQIWDIIQMRMVREFSTQQIERGTCFKMYYSSSGKLHCLEEAYQKEAHIYIFDKINVSASDASITPRIEKLPVDGLATPFSDDLTKVLMLYDNPSRAKMWDIENKQFLWENDCVPGCFSQDGINIMLRCNQVKLFDVISGSEIASGDSFINPSTDRMIGVVENKVILYRHNKNKNRYSLIIVDITTGSEDVVAHGGSFFLGAISNNGRYLAYTNSNTIYIYDLQRLTVISRLAGHTCAVGSLTFSRDDKYLFSAHTSHSDCSNRIWTLTN